MPLLNTPHVIPEKPAIEAVPERVFDRLGVSEMLVKLTAGGDFRIVLVGLACTEEEWAPPSTAAITRADIESAEAFVTANAVAHPDLPAAVQALKGAIRDVGEIVFRIRGVVE